MSPIPASEIFPPAFSNVVPEWIWRPKDVDKGKSVRLYVCSQSSIGWRYYTLNREIRLSKDFPTDYAEDIGYRYGHGPGKVDEKTGEPKEERDKPTQSCLLRVWHVENERMVAAVIDTWTLLQQLDQIFSNPEFNLNDQAGMVSNFYLQVFHNANMGAMTYTAQSFLRPSENPTMFAAASQPWYPDQYWLGLNPFEAPATPPANAGRPAAERPVLEVLRDPHGADHEMELPTERAVVW
jgi:hypothetical protein